MKKLLSGVALLIVSLLAVVPVASQGGSGIIVVPNPSGTDALSPLNCESAACRRLTWLLFPEMVSADPQTGQLEGAQPDNHALLVEPQLQDGSLQTFELREDLLWSDGVPVTAYDVLFSYLAVINGSVSVPNPVWTLVDAARVVDDHTFQLQYFAPDCASLARTNIPIIPSHILDPDFRRFVDESNRASEEIKTFDDWFEVYSSVHFSGLQSDRLSFAPTVTSGIFHFDEFRPNEAIRFSEGATAFVYGDTGEMNSVDYFLSGKSNTLFNPPYEQRDDLRATPDVQIVEQPGVRWDYIVFNTANPRRAKSAFTDSGVPIEQGIHPIFGDLRVRHAVQIGIDVQEIINAVFQGNADPVASSLPPTSWGYNPDLQPAAYDPVGASRLLESAGWKDADQDGTRECHGCQNASEGSLLAFTLSVQDEQSLSVVSSLIIRQLSMIGFSVNLSGESASVQSQNFDAYLASGTSNAFLENNDPDQTALFTPAGDIVGQTGNVGSYHNEEIASLMEQARSVPGCNQSTRAELYRQAQALLQQDQPYAWLYIRRDMFLAQNTVRGFAPIPGNPFWNIRDWVVQP